MTVHDGAGGPSGVLAKRQNVCILVAMTKPSHPPDAQSEHFAAWARAVDEHNAIQDVKLDTLSGIVREIGSDVRVVQRDLQEFRSSTTARFNQVDQHLAAMDRRFDQVDQRLAAADRRFDQVDQHLASVDRRLDAMDARFEGVDARFDGVDSRFDKVESMIQQVLTLVGGTPSA